MTTRPVLEELECEGFGPFTTARRLRLAEGTEFEFSAWQHRKDYGLIDRSPGAAPEHVDSWQPERRDWWIAVLFMIGSVCFAIGSIPLAADAMGAAAPWIFFVGSVFFTSAAYLQYFEATNEGAALDGIYVLRTSAPAERLPGPDVVRAYKALDGVERAFRGLKAVDLQVSPIRHHTEDRVRAHILICMLAYYVRWHLERAWAPLLFRDEARPVGPDPVAPAVRSEAALAKAHTQRLRDGSAVHSFGTLLADLKTLTRNRVKVSGTPDEAAFDRLATPTSLQARALSLSGLTPSSV